MPAPSTGAGPRPAGSGARVGRALSRVASPTLRPQRAESARRRGRAIRAIVTGARGARPRCRVEDGAPLPAARRARKRARSREEPPELGLVLRLGLAEPGQ